MRLTRGQINWVKEFASEGYDLSELLFRNFPDAKISIIKRYIPNLSGNYIHDVYFSREEAEETVKKIPKKSGEKFFTEYYIIEGFFRNLFKGKIFDERMGVPVDEVDQMVIYSKLEKNLK